MDTKISKFRKGISVFEKTATQESYSAIEIGGLVKAFEFTFELGWKTIKDFLYEQGIETKFPREAIKEAYSTQIIEDGHVWIAMLEKRNELSHTYNEGVAQHAVHVIQESYYPAIRQVYHYLKSQLPE